MKKPFQHENAGWHQGWFCSEWEPFPSGLLLCMCWSAALDQFSVAREHIAAFSTISETNHSLLLRLTTEVKNWIYMETSPSWIEWKQVCGQVCFASDAVFQTNDFALQGSLSGTGSLWLVGWLASLYVHFYATISVLILHHYHCTVVGFYLFIFLNLNWWNNRAISLP